MNFCAFLQPDAIPEELFQHDDSFKYGTTVFDEAIAALLRYSLIRRNVQKQTYSMHRLVQAVLIDDMPSDLQTQIRERVVRALNEALPGEITKDLRQYERLLTHALVCATWPEDELTPTVEVAKLFHKASLYQLVRGQYSEAETHLARVLHIYVQNYGAEHPVTAYALTDLAYLYHGQDKVGQAEHLYQHALAILEEHLGAMHPETARTLNLLAFFYLTQGKYGQAEPLLVRAHSIQEKHLGTEHPETAIALYSLAFLYHMQGKDVQAELLYRRALSTLDKHLGAEHPAFAGPLSGLAWLLHNQGLHEQAAAMLQRALSIQEQKLGVTHPDIQSNKRAYANFLHSIGRAAEAAALETNVEPSV